MSMNLPPELLRKVQLKQLEILMEVDNICGNNNINYFMLGGTLLGAVRHGGFIPWDDDLDIGMFREDYDKFVSICKDQLPNKYFLQSTQTDPNYAPPFIKIRANGTIFEEANTRNINTHKGIWIDIFPIDHIKNPNSKLLSIRAKGIAILTTAIGYKNKSININKLKTKIVLSLFALLGIKNIDKIRTNLMSLDKRKKTDLVTNFGSNYGYKKQLMNKEIYLHPKRIQFEDFKAMAPGEYTRWLEKIFNNYMTLPSEENRTSGHNIIRCEIND